ncbi:hypothetical protein HANVADRAFT_22957 [Hanseniaspora valbyensis NRRL Y-1626]|uniref:CBS domain-containing protein n=1 Tax=Hanseniaspora valbyensis NRRL Y-1626 TaxID=766949 RepID=A0A1B7TGA4_9ASCO|nr:hypothetical protein HANVADRAFT_22957 [Hanseniaspora valbyensis NRRL Y-1626]
MPYFTDNSGTNHSGQYHKLYHSLHDVANLSNSHNGSNNNLNNGSLEHNHTHNNSDSRHSSIVELLSLPSSTNVLNEKLNNNNNTSASENKEDMDKLTDSFDNQETLIHKSHKQEWSNIKISNLIQEENLHFIDEDMTVENAFYKLLEYNLTSLPVITSSKDLNDCLTFDYNDLNAYMLLSLNKIKMNKVENESIQKLISKNASTGKPVKVGDIIKFVPKTPFLKINENESLSKILQILGNGVHRVAITDDGLGKEMKIKGILSQRRLLKYLWDNASKFENFEELSKFQLKDLKIGVLEKPFEQKDLQNKANNKHRVIAIEGTQPLIDALLKMYTNQISSIAIIDSNQILLGNISVTDIKYLTHISQYPLLFNTCKHFISYILNKRGLDDGKDSFPIFHVYMNSSLNRCMAKLVATKAHRLWIVDDTISQPSTPTTDNQPPLVGIGKLIGVVSLSDIIGVFVRDSKIGKMEVDPQMARKKRQTETSPSEELLSRREK